MSYIINKACLVYPIYVCRHMVLVGWTEIAPKAVLEKAPNIALEILKQIVLKITRVKNRIRVC